MPPNKNITILSKKKLVPCRSSSPTLDNFERSKNRGHTGRGRGGGGREGMGMRRFLTKTSPKCKSVPSVLPRCYPSEIGRIS